MTDAYQPNDQLHRPGGIPPEAEPVFGTPTVPPTRAPGQSEHSTKDTAKEEAAHVRDTAADAGRNVAGTAKEEARNVAGEAKQQARHLWDQTMHEAQGQAKAQTQRAADGMHTFGGDLRRMASESGQQGLAAQLAGEVGDRVDAAASWLDGREPADLLDEVKRYARQHPGTFIAIAGVAGLVVGRLTRGMIGDAQDQAKGTSTARHADSTSVAGIRSAEARPGGSTQGVVTDWDVPAQTGHQPHGTGIPASTGMPGSTGIPPATGVPTATPSGVPTTGTGVPGSQGDPTTRREGGL